MNGGRPEQVAATAVRLPLLVSENAVAFLENMRLDEGYLDVSQMARAFQPLRPTDLIRSPHIHEYLTGRRQGMPCRMAGNADVTRMPCRMHSEHLREIFGSNGLAEGKYRLGRKPGSVGEIDESMFCLLTTTDHVAPWRSARKLRLPADTPATLVLTYGVCNAGVAGEVAKPRHKLSWRPKTAGDIEVVQPIADTRRARVAQLGPGISTTLRCRSWSGDEPRRSRSGLRRGMGPHEHMA